MSALTPRLVSRLIMRAVIVALILLGGAACGGLQSSAQEDDTESRRVSSPAMSETQSELTMILSLLPEDTDSVLISRGSIPSPPSPFLRPDQRAPAVAPLEQVCSAANMGVLVGAECFTNRETFRKSVENVPVRFTIGAGRRYHCAATPSYEQCCFIVFAAAAPDGLRAELARGARQTHSIHNMPVFEFDYANTEGVPRMDVYAAFPAMDILLVATDLDFLKLILTRLAQPKDNRTTPPLLHGFEAKYNAGTVWGIHRFSPGSRSGAGRQFVPNIDDPDVNLVMVSYSSKNRRLTFAAASTNADSGQQWLEQLTKGLVGPTIPFHVRRSGPALVDVSFVLGDSGSHGEADTTILPASWTPGVAVYTQSLLALGVPWYTVK